MVGGTECVGAVLDDGNVDRRRGAGAIHLIVGHGWGWNLTEVVLEQREIGGQAGRGRGSGLELTFADERFK